MPVPLPPTGTLTFLFTDIAGSTRLWEERPREMAAALARHDALLRAAIEESGGYVFKTVGDAFCAAFERAQDGVRAAFAAQQALAAEAWPLPTPLRVRMALHPGAAEERDGDYFGPPLNRVARLLSLGHGGQVLLSLAAAQLVRESLPPEAALLPLGEHRLKDLERPEGVFQLLHPDLPREFPPLRSLDAHPHNLPVQVTRFIGRERELAELRDRLGKTRLLTLTGPGGTGKTRLALQAAADAVDHYPGGAWLVELAPIADPGLVVGAVAGALGLRESGRPLVETVEEHLRGKPALLLLDNCEHLLEAAAALADRLLRRCPDLVILATSREALGITGEQLYPVPSLALPPEDRRLPPQDLEGFESVRLFADRAVAVAPSFRLTGENAAAVAAICRRLDGIPLALELAAARVRALGPQDLADRLDDRFRLLRGNRAALPRQQTLQALIDWSYDLLSGQERQLLHRLAVFTGGWTLEAAEQVCSDPEDAAAGDLPLVEEWEVLDLLTALVDKSLVAAETHGGESRYRMLESIREYGLERLRASGEERALREVHFRYFTALVERDSMEGPRAAAVLARLDQERSNVRAALEFGLSETEHLQRALDIGGRLQRFWETRGNFGEGRDWLARATGHPAAAPRTAARAEALRALGTLSGSLGDYAAAVPALEESVSIARELGHGPLAVRALSNLGVILYARGDYPGARDLFEQALEVVRSYGDPSDTAMIVGNLGVLYREQGDLDTAWRLFKENVDLLRRLSRPGNLANALSNLGAVAQDRQDLSAARALHEESLGIRREIGDLTGISISLINLGLLTKDQGDYDASAGFVREALEVLERLEERRLTAYALEGAAALAAARGDFQRAGRIWGSAEALREAIGSPLPPNEVDEYARRMAEGQAALGEDGFEAARAQGRALSLDRAIAYARAVERPEP